MKLLGICRDLLIYNILFPCFNGASFFLLITSRFGFWLVVLCRYAPESKGPDSLEQYWVNQVDNFSKSLWQFKRDVLTGSCKAFSVCIYRDDVLWHTTPLRSKIWNLHFILCYGLWGNFSEKALALSHKSVHMQKNTFKYFQVKIISDKIWKIIEECREWPLEFKILWTNKYLVKYSQK